MKKSNLKLPLATLICVLSLTSLHSETVRSKTLRVEHGRPIMVVSAHSVLVLEFVRETRNDAMISHEEKDIRHCRARFRYQLFDGTSHVLNHGEGIVEEIYQTISRSETGSNVKNLGSRVSIDAGEFHLWWSEAMAGARSWIYYRSDSAVRFVQQPEQIAFDGMDVPKFQRYFESRNVREFVAAGKRIQLIGPAVFSGDLPTEKTTSARIESARVRDGAFELNLSNLATNQHYVIESSFESGSGGWTAVHTFIAGKTNQSWTDPLGKDSEMVFYRIRAGRF
ncbi:MAG: hypothetical protein ABIQ35_12605 [Verrucomicrobiota bacterium]